MLRPGVLSVGIFRNRSNNLTVQKEGVKIAVAFTESNREGTGCEHYLISQDIDSDYKNYLTYNLLINI